MSTLKEKIAEAKRRLSIMEAAEGGADIQFCVSSGCYNIHNPNFDSWDTDDYRIKPQPKEIWVNEHSSGEMFVHDSQEKAESYGGPSIINKAVHYKEVIS